MFESIQGIHEVPQNIYIAVSLPTGTVFQLNWSSPLNHMHDFPQLIFKM